VGGGGGGGEVRSWNHLTFSLSNSYRFPCLSLSLSVSLCLHICACDPVRIEADRVQGRLGLLERRRRRLLLDSTGGSNEVPGDPSPGCCHFVGWLVFPDWCGGSWWFCVFAVRFSCCLRVLYSFQSLQIKVEAFWHNDSEWEKHLSDTSTKRYYRIVFFRCFSW
jgi:hypothetical protein